MATLRYGHTHVVFFPPTCVWELKYIDVLKIKRLQCYPGPLDVVGCRFLTRRFLAQGPISAHEHYSICFFFNYLQKMRPRFPQNHPTPLKHASSLDVLELSIGQQPLWSASAMLKWSGDYSFLVAVWPLSWEVSPAVEFHYIYILVGGREHELCFQPPTRYLSIYLLLYRTPQL